MFFTKTRKSPLYIRQKIALCMQHRSVAFTLLIVAILVSITLGIYVATAAYKPSSTGEVVQSPYVYALFLALLLVMGFLFTKVLSGENSRFSYRTFINVSLAGLLFSGLVHEFVHILLINHPVQLRFHFGDSNAILSTCCLAPGEQPYEGIAYGIQFLALFAWLFFNRRTFYNGRFRELWKNNPSGNSPVKKNTFNAKTKKNPAVKQDEMGEDDLEKEWNTHKTEMENHLARKIKSGKKDSNIEQDIQNIRRLKA